MLFVTVYANDKLAEIDLDIHILYNRDNIITLTLLHNFIFLYKSCILIMAVTQLQSYIRWNVISIELFALTITHASMLFITLHVQPLP